MQDSNRFKDITETRGVFMGAGASYEDAKAVIMGIPMDYTVSYRAGTRSGPLAVRNTSIALEEYSLSLNRSLADCCYYDLGDLALPFGNAAKSLEIIEKVAESLLEDDKFPIFLGGEHLISYPVIKSFFRKYPNLKVIHFDAHADLRLDYYGEEYSHSTVMRKAAGILGMGRIYQFGIRSGIKEEIEFAREYTRLYPLELLEPLKEILPELKGNPVYLTLDIDVVDPAFAPGTGTPEPGGCSSKEIIEAVHLLSELDVVGFDLVEVSPQLDISERTAILAAKIVREGILTLVK